MLFFISVRIAILPSLEVILPKTSYQALEEHCGNHLFAQWLKLISSCLADCSEMWDLSWSGIIM